MLVVASSVRMIHGVHGHAAHLGPAVPLHAVLMVGVASLEHRFLRPAAAGDLPDHGATAARQDLLGARGELDPARACVYIRSVASYQINLNTNNMDLDSQSN